MSRVKVVVRIRPLLDGEAAHTCDALRIEPLDGEGQPQPGLLTVHKPTGDDVRRIPLFVCPCLLWAEGGCLGPCIHWEWGQ